MRSFRHLAYCVIPVCISFVCSGAGAQQNTPGAQGPSDQWVSHQMNQPPPSTDKGLSQERLDEIRQLYEEAKKDADAKSSPKAGPQK